MDCTADNIKAIAGYIESGEKIPGQGKLGLEEEHFTVREDTGESVSIYDGYPTDAILGRFARFYPEKTVTDGVLLGLASAKAHISVEPAGQLEISVEPESAVAAIEGVYTSFREIAREILSGWGLRLECRGYHPVSGIDDIPIIPKERYRHMSRYLPQKGALALNMMKGTAATQVSVDYFSESDFSRKHRLATLLAPLFFMMTDNTLMFEGKKAPNLVRMRIWEQTDPDRTGYPEGSLDGVFGYEDYARYIYARPPIISLIGGEQAYTAGSPCSEVYQGTLMDLKTVEHVLGMFFPDVRAKRYLEIRCADSMETPLSMAFCALMKGLFYTGALGAWSDRLRGAGAADERETRRSLKEDARPLAYGMPADELCIGLLDSAYDELRDEREYLIPLYRKLGYREPVVRSRQ